MHSLLFALADAHPTSNDFGNLSPCFIVDSMTSYQMMYSHLQRTTWSSVRECYESLTKEEWPFGSRTTRFDRMIRNDNNLG